MDKIIYILYSITQAGDSGTNVILVDWVEASTNNYYQAVTNSMLVGDQLVSLLNLLKVVWGVLALLYSHH